MGFEPNDNYQNMRRKLFLCWCFLSSVAAVILVIHFAGCKKTCCTIGYELVTDSVYAFTYHSAMCHVTITSEDSDSITECGVCWSTRSSPTTGDDTTVIRYGQYSFSSLLHDLNGSMVYFVRAYVTNNKGTKYGNELSFKTPKAPVFTIGENYAGGIIFYIQTPGYVHGLIAATADQGDNTAWGCPGILITGTDSSNGKYNTLAITTECTLTDIAAKICQDFTSVYDTGWYLPSKEELTLLYHNRNYVGGFTGGFYWSSTQSDADSAWGQSFADSSQVIFSKDKKIHVRAIRAF